VPLANFFGVTTDELFSLNEQINDAKIKEYEDKSRKFFNLGDMQACIDLMREALAEYPRNYTFMKTLAQAIEWDSYSKMPDISKYEEVISLCERILEDCTDNHTRNGTMQILCTAYNCAGQNEKAVKLAKEMPGFSATSDWLLSGIYEGYKRIEQKQNNILFCVWYAAFELSELSRDLDCDDKIAYLEAALKLHETIFYDGNALYYHTWIHGICYELASCYMQKDIEKSMEYLLAAEKHAVANDAVPHEMTFYTSIFVNKIAHSTANTLKSSTETSCEQFLKRLNDGCFAPLYDNPEFIAIKERLAKNKPT
jgi:tetratricopeptide (TPR) repeat protein